MICDRTPESNIPGPPPFPIIDRWRNMLYFGRDAVGYCGRLFDRYGKVAIACQSSIPNPPVSIPGAGRA
jgi:hypothetical protein